jgi:hypothetical protein
MKQDVFLEKLIFTIMKLEVSLPRSYVSATRLYPTPDKSAVLYFLDIHFNIILPSTPSSSLSLLKFSDQNFVLTYDVSYAYYMPKSFHPP